MKMRMTLAVLSVVGVLCVAVGLRDDSASRAIFLERRHNTADAAHRVGPAPVLAAKGDRQTETVDSVDSLGDFSSLVVYGTALSHFSHFDTTNETLKYAHYDGTAWYVETVDTMEWRGAYTTLELSGQLYISYDDRSPANLKYARRTTAPAPPSLRLKKEAMPQIGLRNNGTLTYTLTISGTGLHVELRDPLPAGVQYIGDSVTPPAVYSPASRAIVWAGTLPTDTVQVIRFQVTPGITGAGSLSLALPIKNTAWLTDTDYGRSISATVIANGSRIYLPLMVRKHPLQQIAFTSHRDGNSEIYVITSDGTGLTRLTNHPAIDERPAWSPDGTTIAFLSYRDSPSGNEIYTMKPDGTAVTRLTDTGGWKVAPVWSPDGTKIAFQRDEDIYVMNADGTGLTSLTDDNVRDGGISWSPDSSTIAFFSDRDNLWGEIYVVKVDGKAITRLTNNEAWDGSPAWSPDGSKIAFESNRDSPGAGEIYVMNADGTGVSRLTHTDLVESHPAWSPDGNKIAITVDTPPFSGYRYEIYVMNADGTELSNVTNHPQRDDFFGWSPDGTRILFWSDRDPSKMGDVYIMNADGTGVTRLTDDPAYDGDPVWRPTLN